MFQQPTEVILWSGVQAGTEPEKCTGHCDTVDRLLIHAGECWHLTAELLVQCFTVVLLVYNYLPYAHLEKC